MKAENFSTENQPVKRRGKSKRTLLLEKIKIGCGTEFTNEECVMLLRQMYSADIRTISKLAQDKSAPAFLNLTAKMLASKDIRLAIQRLREIERILKLDETPIVQDNEINIIFENRREIMQIDTADSKLY